MIADIDRTLEKLFQIEFGAPLPFDLSFAIPDKTFGPVSNAKNTLNCYLYDIREDRELRQVEPRIRRTTTGSAEKEYPPARIKLSYCITAWSPLQMGPNIPPALDEHGLLSQVLRVLLRYPTLPAAALTGMVAGQQPPLPTIIVQPDLARNSGDFWNAIGGQLRPSLEYSVTFSLDYYPLENGPLVTSIQTHIGEREADALRLTGSADEGYVVGGSVWSSAVPNTIVPDAWVRVDQTGEVSVADAMGHYILNRIRPGAYTAKVRAKGFKEGNLAMQVPNTAGSYDVTLDPL